MNPLVTLAAIAASVLLIVVGVALVYVPAGLIVAGVFGLAALGMLGYLKGAKRA